jgi:hypothetical protein
MKATTASRLRYLAERIQGELVQTQLGRIKGCVYSV